MKKILVIEDDEINRVFLMSILEEAGHQALEANNGKTGITIFQKESPDLVVTDMLMPEQDGIETLSLLKKIQSDIPIIAISGGGRVKPENYLEAAQIMGAAKTFIKPINRQEFLKAVEELLN